jgi:hypothetical protein
MNIPNTTADDLIFGWDRPGRGKWTIAGFLFGSLVVHALGFYLFQIVYPPAVTLLPPPGRVSLIAPTSEEGRLLLGWVDAEDPALASTTQPLPGGKSLVMPTIQHAPSYLTRQPALKELPPAPAPLRIPSARPPAPVEPPTIRVEPAAKIVPTVVRFSPELEALGPAQVPELKFTASSQESPQAARFRIAVNANGQIRHCFLQNSSGEAVLDEQARKYLALSRFSPTENRRSKVENDLVWGTATLEWGNDLTPSSPPNPSPTAP